MKLFKKVFNKPPKDRQSSKLNGTNGTVKSPKSPKNAPYRRPGPQSLAGRAPAQVLVKIFEYVAPHTLDQSYLAEEEVTRNEEGCVLCDIRDLSKLAKVCQNWNTAAQQILYKNIRLETVHYCGLEEDLVERRKRRSFFHQDADTVDVPAERMKLLTRTIRENETLTVYPLFLRMQYMTRQSEKDQLMKLISLLPKLRYADLPDGFYRDEQSCQPMKALMYQRCPDLRKMRWDEGSESSFINIPRDRPWQSLESIQLTNLKIEEYTILRVLAVFPRLSMLSLSNLPLVTDQLLDPDSQQFPGLQLPALRELVISKCDQITFDGVKAYLSRQDVQLSMNNLALKELNIPPHLLQQILSITPYLKTMFISAPVTRAFPRHETPVIPLLNNPSLRDLSYEIRDESSSKGLERPASTYYDYLCESIRGGRLPKLTIVRVREQTFYQRIEAAVIGLEQNGWQGQIRRQLKTIEVYAKGWDDLNWKIWKAGSKPPAVVDDNDFGAFIALSNAGMQEEDYGMPIPKPPRNLFVPDDGRRMSWKEKLENRNSRMDLWR